MAGRKYNQGSYRYGFNGVESVPELKEGHNTTFFREQDSRIGRWWSIDPKNREFESPYVMMGNNPIMYADMLGDTVKAPNKIVQTAIDELVQDSPAFAFIYNELHSMEDVIEIKFEDVNGTGGGFRIGGKEDGNIRLKEKPTAIPANYKSAVSEELIHAYQGVVYGFFKTTLKISEIRNQYKEGKITLEEVKKQSLEIQEKVEFGTKTGMIFIETEAKLIKELVLAEQLLFNPDRKKWQTSASTVRFNSTIKTSMTDHLNKSTIQLMTSDEIYEIQLEFIIESEPSGTFKGYEGNATPHEAKVLNKVLSKYEGGAFLSD